MMAVGETGHMTAKRDQTSEAADAAKVGPGRLVLVVGPSGVGKDTLIDRARARFGADPAFLFPRRIVTRPADTALEDHDSVAADAFDDLAAAGRFALHWRAHGLAYGLPVTVDDAIRAGRTVIANVSRAILAAARAKYQKLRVIHVTASTGVLATRLGSRGRENPADIAARMARATELDVAGPDVVVIDNSGDLDQAAAAFLEAIHR